MEAKSPWSGEHINAHQKFTKFTAHARHPVEDPKLKRRGRRMEVGGVSRLDRGWVVFGNRSGGTGQQQETDRWITSRRTLPHERWQEHKQSRHGADAAVAAWSWRHKE